MRTDWQTEFQWESSSRTPPPEFVARIREKATFLQLDLDGVPPAEYAIGLNYSPGQHGNRTWHVAQKLTAGWKIIGELDGEPGLLPEKTAGMHDLECSWYEGGGKYGVCRYAFRSGAYIALSTQVEVPVEVAPKTVTLLTPSFRITITDPHGEGCVSCNQLVYHGVSRRTGAAVTLTGSTVNTHGPDGTPAHFQGYEFASGDARYFISDAGKLRVTRGGRELVNEDGRWEK